MTTDFDDVVVVAHCPDRLLPVLLVNQSGPLAR
jgi:hypothetical protein